MSKIQEWSARGICLDATDNRGIDPQVLLAFTRRAINEFAGKQIHVTEHGELRVTDYDRQDGGPYLEWRD